jgi:hypothetical protein
LRAAKVDNCVSTYQREINMPLLETMSIFRPLPDKAKSGKTGDSLQRRLAGEREGQEEAATARETKEGRSRGREGREGRKERG